MDELSEFDADNEADYPVTDSESVSDVEVDRSRRATSDFDIEQGILISQGGVSLILKEEMQIMVI